jgi:orotate phosphoribosyltransferase
VTLIEDVITTGGVVKNATSALRDRGASVDVVVCAIDRSANGSNQLSKWGVSTRAVLTRTQLDATAQMQP